MTPSPTWCADDDTLIAMKAAGHTYREIAVVLGRSLKAVEYRAYTLRKAGKLESTPLEKRRKPTLTGKEMDALPWPPPVKPILQPPLPIEEEGRDSSAAYRAGHPRSWNLINRGTVLDGTAWPGGER